VAFYGSSPRSASEERERGPGSYLSALYVLAEAHGREWVVNCLAPARAFYEHLGAQYAATRTIQDGTDRWEQCSYEWPDVTPLLAPSRSHSVVRIVARPSITRLRRFTRDDVGKNDCG
jgi:hypothetical protein